MKSDVKKDYDWSNEFLSDISKILRDNAIHFISVEVADDKDDREKATDMVIKVDTGNVAVRIRRDDCKYRDLTIRASRSNGYKTELAKIKNGFAKWYLYIWTDNGRISDWILVDLDKVRKNKILDMDWNRIPNKDGKTSFITIPVFMLKQYGCLVNEYSSNPVLALTYKESLF